MKFLSYTFLAAVAASGLAVGQNTTPVGYVTQNLAADSFNLVGLTLHPSSIVSGEISSVTGTSIAVESADFDSSLTSGSTYVLEITSGTGAGVIQEVVSWSGSSLVLVQDLTASGIGVQAGDSFRLRKAPTLEEVFGTTQTVLTKGFTSGAADIVWLPDGVGGYNLYFLHSTNQWRSATSNLASPNVPLVYTDGILIQKKSSAASLIQTGEVKTDSTKSIVQTGFNVISVVAPAGSTLQNLGLESGLTAGFTSGAADIVWVPTTGGSYDLYFRHSTNVWRNATTNTNVTSDVSLPSAIWIQRKGAAANVTLKVPTEYGNF